MYLYTERKHPSSVYIEIEDDPFPLPQTVQDIKDGMLWLPRMVETWVPFSPEPQEIDLLEQCINRLSEGFKQQSPLNIRSL